MNQLYPLLLILNFLASFSLFGMPPVNLFINADAHEGPVYVPWQHRLYFTTNRNEVNGQLNVAIQYLDLKTLEVFTFIPNANMANGMFLSEDGKHLLVAEQGTFDTLGGISRIHLDTGEREVLVDHFHGKPFNSPNKVIQSHSGLIYFSDPNYGYNQGFKPSPVLPNAVYVFNPQTSEINRLTTRFKMPHGLALTNHDRILLVGDTEAINGKDPFDPHKAHDIFKITLHHGHKVRSIKHLLTVRSGIPDGFIIAGQSLYVATGDGIERYDKKGNFKEIYPIAGGAINLALAKKALLVTANSAIYHISPIRKPKSSPSLNKPSFIKSR